MIQDRISLIDIFVAFLYSGLILLGGGYIILPILQKELVEKRKWLQSEELTDYYAISQSLPGLIAINMSVLVGYKLRGKMGALAGVTGITFFAFWAIVVFSSILTVFASNIYVQGAFWGIGIAVVVLIVSAIREMWGSSVKDKPALALYIIVLLLMILFNLPPAWVIISSIFIGITYNILIKKISEDGKV